MNSPTTMSIGELARRTGLSVSAIRFYESRGLVRATRGAGNQRRFMRADIRRLSFALIAQQLGLRRGSRITAPAGRSWSDGIIPLGMP
jgi:MerR family redox-sensitive transcriptional activator SoxR